MCSITGYLSFSERTTSSIRTRLAKLLRLSEQRGRDGFGYTSFDSVKKTGSEKHVPTKERKTIEFSEDFYEEILIRNRTSKVFLANHRAEPTTEFIPHKTIRDQQPYTVGPCSVVHNGTIANDKDLIKELWKGTDPTPTIVDSYSLAVYANERGVSHLFKDVKGSLACLFWNQSRLEFHAVRNYKPLNVVYLVSEQTWIFSSLPEVFDLFPEARVMSFPPYSIMTSFTKSGQYHLCQFPPQNRHKALVICSGGLDSTTAAAIAKTQCSSVTLLHFLYGCQAEVQEKKAVIQIADALDCGFKFVNMDWLKRLGGSSLTEEGHISDGISGAEFAHEWVPARNTAMIGIAAAYADRLDCGTIYLGLNLEEGGAYPDNTVEFYTNFNRVLDVGTQARPVIVNPLANKTKKEIVELAYKIKAPIHLSWSCYKGGDRQCGVCGPCHMRRVAHQMLGVKDTIVYADER